MNTYSIINASLLDGKKDMTVQNDMTVIVKSGKIFSIEQNGKALEGEPVYDLKGAYLMPGLINMHVHLAAAGKAPKPNAKPVNYKKLFDTLSKSKVVLKVLLDSQKTNAKNELYSGVTTLRAVGGILDLDGKTRDLINSGKIEGPRILAANTAVSVPGGHFAGSLATEARDATMAAEDVKKIAKTNPDLIKIMVTGGVMDAEKEGEPGVLRMAPALVKSACDEAHRNHFKVAAHVESTEGVKVALENGVDTIEHGAPLTPELVELFKKKGAAHICTVSPALPYCKFDLSVSHAPELGKINGTIVMDGIVECAKQCLENDIPVGLGTDTGCPFITHYDMWRELLEFVQYVGVTPEFALHTATLKNAEILGISDITGSIEVGKNAEMIVSRENPLDTFENLKNLEYVFKGDTIVTNPKIKRMKAVDDAFATVGL